MISDKRPPKNSSMVICLVASGRVREVYWGGEERFTLSLARWLEGRGISTVVIGRKLLGVEEVAQNGSEDQNDSPVERPKVIRLPYFIYALTLIVTSALLTMKIMQVNKRRRVTIIHAQDTGYAGLSAALAGKILNIPVVISSHGVRYLSLRKGFGSSLRLELAWEWWIDNLVMRLADSIVCESSFVKRFLYRESLRMKMNVIPAAIEVIDFSQANTNRDQARRILMLEEGEIAIGYVGRLSPEKNVAALVDAFSIVLHRLRNARLVIVGDGPLMPSLQKMCLDRNIEDKVTFLGTRHDIGVLLGAFDIFILPSFTEGSCLALLEAMASGKAIVASDIGSIREVVSDSGSAMLVNPTKVEEFARATISLASDPLGRTNFGEKAARRASLYDESKIYPRFLALYERLAASHITRSSHRSINRDAYG